MHDIDLSSIIQPQASQRPFVFAALVSRNGIGLTKNALVDTGCGGYALINRALTAQVMNKIPSTTRVKLSTPVAATGFKNGAQETITHAVILDLTICGQHEYRVPFLEVTLSNHDFILGREWLSHNQIYTDVAGHRLLWPDHPERKQEAVPSVMHNPTSRILPLGPDRHQETQYNEEITSRQAKMDAQDKKSEEKRRLRNPRVLPAPQPQTKIPTVLELRPQDSVRPLPGTSNKQSVHFTIPPQILQRRDRPLPIEPGPEEPHLWQDPDFVPDWDEEQDPKDNDATEAEYSDDEEATDAIPIVFGRSFLWDNRKDIRKMEDAIHDRNQPQVEVNRIELDPAPLDAYLIKLHAFNTYFKDPDVEIGTVSLYEVNRMIADRKNAIDQMIPHLENTVDVEEMTIFELDLTAQEARQGMIDSIPTDEDPETREKILAKLPPYLAELAKGFSKSESNKLPPLREGVDHKIELLPDKQHTPGFCPLYNQSLEELEFIKKYLTKNLEQGFIETSNSPFQSPILVAKKQGPPGEKPKFRFCIDFRRLNEATKKDRYPIPLLDETLQRLSRAKFFTKLDIRQAFHRIRMHPDSEELSTFRTRYGSFKCKVMPFGLCNSPASWQRYLNNILFAELDTVCTAYLDDILIYSEDLLSHQAHVQTVVSKLQAAGLQIDIDKCEFSVQKTKYLGFIISTTGISVDPEKIAAVKFWQLPKKLKNVQAFLGFCNFYRRFIRNFSRIARPLTRLTKKGIRFDMNDACLFAFEKLKEMLMNAPVLALYDPHKKTRMETDASDGATGGVLHQLGDDGEWHPVAFFSKILNVHEINYEIHDKEMLAVVQGLKTWRAELQGLQQTPFTAITDHRALEFFSTKRVLNPRQMRWSQTMAGYNFKIEYRPGKENVIADALSRKAEDLATHKELADRSRFQELIKPTQLGMELLPMEVSPTQLSVIERLLELNRTSESLQTLRDKASPASEDVRNNWTINTQDLLLFQGRLVVPDEGIIKTELIREIHDSLTTAHPGRNKTRKIVSRQFYWPRMNADIDIYVNACQTCRRSSVPRDKAPGLLKPLPIPSRVWEHITIDFCTFPESKSGKNNVMVVVDKFGKRPISIPTSKEITGKHAAWLYFKYIWRWVGTPSSITSDRGPQFISDWDTELSKLLRLKKKLSTAYHAQTDGQTEIANQILQQRLRPFINYFQDDWPQLLPAMDFAAATLPHETTGLAPTEIEMGFIPRMHFDWDTRTTQFDNSRERFNKEDAQHWAKRIHEAYTIARRNIEKSQATQSKQANKKRRPENFDVDSMVYLLKRAWRTDRPSDKLDFPVCGPYKIIEKVYNSWKLELPSTFKMHPVFHSDRLRLAPEASLPGQLNANDPADSYIVDGTVEWEVSRVISSKLAYRKLLYQVDWLGWDPDPTWYPASNFKNSALLLKQYHDDNPTKPGPPKRLRSWLDANEKDEDHVIHKDDELPATQNTAISRRGFPRT